VTDRSTKERNRKWTYIRTQIYLHTENGNGSFRSYRLRYDH